ncbi:MAG TPA: GNAT family N-acetyltransferase [Thermoanaerobaculia bacterium]|nr:GNAT family N-acetyltransferase [Thermoanaerobaculia bacterium]
MDVQIRSAEAGDAEAVVALMRELAEHDGLSQYMTLTPEELAELLAAQRFEVLIATAGDAVVGYASYLMQFAPWAAREYLYLDDLYVAKSGRGAGIGSRLMQAVGELALKRNVDVRWHVEKENTSAHGFYRSLGAQLRERYSAYWMRDAIREQLRAKS